MKTCAEQPNWCEFKDGLVFSEEEKEQLFWRMHRMGLIKQNIVDQMIVGLPLSYCQRLSQSIRCDGMIEPTKVIMY